jgi:sulfoxide reductase heme-binding subunit YedZ
VKDVRFSKVVLFINALVPLTWMLWDWAHHRLGVNPIEFVTRATGVLTLVFLLLSLTVTPIRVISKQNWLIKFRRMLGLFAFFYGTLHFATYLWFDRGLVISSIPGDIWNRAFIALGLSSFLMLVPLAITSTKGMIKRLGGRRWSQLHRIVYAAAIGGVIHYYLIVKSDTRWPIAFGVVLALLLGFRIYEENREPAAPAKLAP